METSRWALCTVKTHVSNVTATPKSKKIHTLSNHSEGTNEGKGCNHDCNVDRCSGDAFETEENGGGKKKSKCRFKYYLREKSDPVSEGPEFHLNRVHTPKSNNCSMIDRSGKETCHKYCQVILAPSMHTKSLKSGSVKYQHVRRENGRH